MDFDPRSPAAMQVARSEMRAMLDGADVAVTEGEFERIIGIQADMRTKHVALATALERSEFGPEDFLDASDANLARFMREARSILGADRYRAVFDTDDTDDGMPIDRKAFIAGYRSNPPARDVAHG